MTHAPCLRRTSHRVILGEHDRSSNAEDIQVMKVAKVSDKHRHLFISSAGGGGLPL